MNVLTGLILLVMAWLVFYWLKGLTKTKATATTPKKPKSKTHDLDSENHMVKIPSSSGDSHYWVGLSDLTCTCPDFLDRRIDFQINDPRRLCKHIMKAIEWDGTIPSQLSRYEDKILHLAGLGRGFPLSKKIVETQINGKKTEAWLADDKTSKWSDVFSDGVRYGYNHEEMRWAYGTAPAHSEQIEKWIHKEIGQPLHDPISKSEIETLSLNEKDGSYLLVGKAGGYRIDAWINPRASWMDYIIDGEWEGSLNVKTKANNTIPRFRFMENALSEWISAKHFEVRQSLIASKKEVVTTDEELAAFKLIVNLIVECLPENAELTYKDTLTYFSVNLNDNPRKWICRLHLNAQNTKYLELPGKEKIAITNIVDIIDYRKDLEETVRKFARPQPIGEKESY